MAARHKAYIVGAYEPVSYTHLDVYKRQAAILALQQNEIALAESRFKHLVTLDIPDKSLAYYCLLYTSRCV